MLEYINQMDKINTGMKKVFDNPYVSNVVIVVGILYATLLAPNLPPKVAQLFGQNLFNLIVLFLIAYVSLSDITVALVLAIGFIMSFQTYNRLVVENQVEVSSSMFATHSPQKQNDMQDPSQVLQKITDNKTAQMILPPDTGFETGTVTNGCYGSVTGLQGYDPSDYTAEY
jgi:hypothetical protein